MSEQQRSYSTLTLAYEGAIAVLTLNRPEKRNAISYELIDDVLRGLADVEQSSAQIVILTGSGKAFCSGMDLDNLKSITGRSAEENRADSATMARLFRTLYEFPRVTIAAVNGPAIAGGCGLATLCDFTRRIDRGEVRLHRGAYRICSRDCVDLPASPGRGEAGARSAAYGTHNNRRRSVATGSGKRGGWS